MRSSTLLKYEIIDVFCVKYTVPLSLKMSSASVGLRSHTSYRVRPQTPYLGFAPGPDGYFSPPGPSFVESKKSLNYTLVRSGPRTGVSVRGTHTNHFYLKKVSSKTVKMAS